MVAAIFFLVASVIIFGSGRAFASTIAVYTDSFITSPTNVANFDTASAGILLPTGQTNFGYSEGGLTVSLVGYNPGALSPISGPYWFGEGQQLYIGAFTGYVSIKMTNGANFQSLQVLTSAGYIGITTSFLGYEVLEQGSLLTSGLLAVHDYSPGHGLYSQDSSEYVGFSGGGFNDPTSQCSNHPRLRRWQHSSPRTRQHQCC